MSGSAPKGGAAGEALVETARMAIQCPIFHSRDEGVVMEVVQFLLDAQRDKHALWGYFHSVPWPPSFFTSYPETDAGAAVAGQGLVMVTADCRSSEHAKSLLKRSAQASPEPLREGWPSGGEFQRLYLHGRTPGLVGLVS